MILGDSQGSKSVSTALEAVSPTTKMADEDRLTVLVRRFQNGDGYAFEALRDFVTPMVTPVISRFVRNHADAQDTMQDVAIQLYRSLPRFRGECQVSTFIYRVTLNVCMNCKKRLARNPLTFTDLSSPDSDDSFDVLLPSDPHHTPERACVSREREGMLHALIFGLDPRLRAVLVLTDVCGMSQQEIADILRAPLNTVKTRQKRARDAMQKKILAHRELFGRIG